MEKILFSIHAILAATSGVPELELEEPEAKKLAAAIEGVSDQYKIMLDPRTAAWIELTQVAGVIYGPRAVSFYLRKKMEAKTVTVPQRPAPAPAPASAPAKANGAAAGYVFDPAKVILDS